jgi:hypothetical protein
VSTMPASYLCGVEFNTVSRLRNDGFLYNARQRTMLSVGIFITINRSRMSVRDLQNRYTRSRIQCHTLQKAGEKPMCESIANYTILSVSGSPEVAGSPVDLTLRLRHFWSRIQYHAMQKPSEMPIHEMRLLPVLIAVTRSPEVG